MEKKAKLREDYEKNKLINNIINILIHNIENEIEKIEAIKKLPNILSQEIIEIFSENFSKMMINFDRGENFIPKKFEKALDAIPELKMYPKDIYLWEEDKIDSTSEIGK